MGKLEFNKDELDLIIYCVNEALEEEFKNQFSTQLQWELEKLCDKLIEVKCKKVKEPIFFNSCNDFINYVNNHLESYDIFMFTYNGVDYEVTSDYFKEILLIDIYTCKYRGVIMDVRDIDF